MAWTYTDDPANVTLDEYRFKIGDNISTRPILSDAEINYVLATYTAEYERLYYLYTASTNKLSTKAKIKLGPLSEDYTSLIEHYAKLAAEYKKYISQSSAPTMATGHTAIFDIGMHDNE